MNWGIFAGIKRPLFFGLIVSFFCWTGDAFGQSGNAPWSSFKDWREQWSRFQSVLDEWTPQAPEAEKPSRRQIAILIEDGPSESTAQMRTLERLGLIVQKLEEQEVPEVGFFVNPSRESSSLSSIYYDWIAQTPHFVANHNFTHAQVSSVLLPKFLEDIRRADQKLRPLEAFSPFFLFPHLNEGETSLYFNEVRGELDRLGYDVAYVTIPSFDWYMDHLVMQQIRRGGEVHFERLQQIYLEHIFDCIEFYDELSKVVLDEGYVHVLSLQENDLTALFIDQLIPMLRDSGWEIVALSEAYRRPIPLPENLKFPVTGSRISQIARSLDPDLPLRPAVKSHEFIDRVFFEAQVFGPISE